MKEFDLWDPQNEIVQNVYKGENYCIWDRNGEGRESFFQGMDCSTRIKKKSFMIS